MAAPIYPSTPIIVPLPRDVAPHLCSVHSWDFMKSRGGLFIRCRLFRYEKSRSYGSLGDCQFGRLDKGQNEPFGPLMGRCNRPAGEGYRVGPFGVLTGLTTIRSGSIITLREMIHSKNVRKATSADNRPPTHAGSTIPRRDRRICGSWRHLSENETDVQYI